jgi:hypothetical protein
MQLVFPYWLGVPISVLAGAIACSIQPHPSSFAAAGAVIAVMGVLTIGRPIMRLGYSKWLTASRLIDGGHYSENDEPPE